MASFLRILRDSLSDFRAESTLLIVANALWVSASVPGMAILGYGAILRSLPLVVAGTVVLLPWPFITFGVFYLAHEVADDHQVGLRTLWEGGRRLLPHAYVWGLANLVVLAVLLSNYRYYSTPGTRLGGTTAGYLLSSFYLSLTLIWVLWQWYALGIFPETERPRYGGVYRRAAYLLLVNPLQTLGLAAVLLMLVLGGIFLPVLGLLISVSAAAVLSTRARITMAPQVESQPNSPANEP